MGSGFCRSGPSVRKSNCLKDNQGGIPARNGGNTPLIILGGAERDRTVDLLTASQALSQLSYSPLMNKKSIIFLFITHVNIFLTIFS
jgi:hypothetical protein